MGTCSYCGQDAGWFRSTHAECKENANHACQELTSLAKAMAEGKDPLCSSEKFRQIAKGNFVPPEEVSRAVVRGWEMAVENCLADRFLSSEEEKSVMDYAKHFNVSQVELDKNGMYSKLVMSGVLRDIVERRTINRLNLIGSSPFNLQKKESLVWVFKSVRFHEEKTSRHYEGGSQGFSVRVAKGITYRTSQFKGRPVDISTLVHVDTGLLGITTKHVYFAGPRKSFRSHYDKIVSFIPYSDGFGVHRDTPNAKPQTFQTGQGWFAYSLVTELAEWHREAS